MDTCKGLIAQKDLELKKLKDSNDLRGKRISNLESLAQESRNFIIKQSKLFKHNDVTIPYDLQAGASSNCDHVNQAYSYSESNKINDLESKSNSMQHQITLLTSKLDTLQFQFLVEKNTLCDDSNQSTQNSNHAKKGSLKIFLCEICDKECNSKVEIKKHSQEHLPELSCNKCDFKTPSSADLKEH